MNVEHRWLTLALVSMAVVMALLWSIRFSVP
jgi:hypothetical protein